MSMVFICKGSLLLVAVVLTATGDLVAQKSKPTSKAQVFKKQVIRTIEIKEEEDNGRHHLRDVTPDASFNEMLVKEVKTGKLKAFTSPEGQPAKAIPLSEFRSDTSEYPIDDVEDPVTGKTVRVRRYMDRDLLSYINKYWIAESWSFDPVAGKTEVSMVGIAPIFEQYNTDGKLMYTEPFFWLKYGDVQNIITKYAEYYPEHSFAAKVWDDYFTNDIKPSKKMGKTLLK